MKAKEIILLILIVLAGVSFYYVYTGKLHINFDDVEGLRFTSRERFTFEDSQVIEPPFPGKLKITNSHGNIEIYGTEEATITIHFQKEIWRKKEEQAAEFSEKLRMVIDKDSQQIVISTNRDEFERGNFKTNFSIHLPQEMDIDLENSYGLVRVSNVRNTIIKNRYGKVIASDIEGTLAIQNSYKDVEVENIQSNFVLESKYSPVLVKNIKGDTKITSKYGKIELENISKKIEIASPHTEIFGQKLMDSVEIESSYKNITLSDVGPTKITGYHSSIEIDGAHGDVKINDSYSRVKLTDITGNLTINGTSLAVNGRTIVGDEISISTSYKNIDLVESSGKITISLSHGDITLEPVSITQAVRINGDYADITFLWPQGEKYPFEARVKNGEIKWKLPAETSLWEEDHTTILKAFLKEVDKPTVFLSTTYGDILVEEY